MGSWKKRIIRVFVLVCFVVLVLLNCNMGVGGVVLQESGDEYEIILYDKWGQVVCDETTEKCPGIRYITDDIVEVTHSFGSPFHYIYYYNIRTAEMSVPAYFNPILIDNKYVAYWDYDLNVLVITDMFQKGIYHKEIKRDFTYSPNPTGVILSMELTEDGENFVMTYYAGKDYEEVEEMIPLWD